MATIVVVGGGLAGLSCAWRLVRQGHDVRVLERGSRPGGRARSERRGAFLLETGAPVVVPGQRRVMALAREAGLLGSLRPLAFGRDLRWRGPGLEASAARRPAEERSRRLQAIRAARDFRRPARAFVPGVEARPQDALRDAAADAIAWWPLAPDPFETATRPMLRDATPHAFAGGYGALVDALTRRFEVFADCEVQAVESDLQGAVVSYRVADGGERRDQADLVVMAVPATQVVPLCPKLTPEERGFFAAAHSMPGIVVHWMLDQVTDTGLRSLRLEGAGLELRSLHFEHARPGAAPHGAGLLRVELATETASRMFRASDAAVADRVLENLAASPLGALRPAGFAVWRHADFAPRFDADHALRLARFVRRLDRSPRTVFAGDFLAGPSTDGAVASGFSAAREVDLVLGATSPS